MTAANDNPYAPPQSFDESPAVSVEPHRQGNLLVTPNGGELPMRCYVCNGEGELPHAVRATGWVSLRGVAARVDVLAFVCRAHRRRAWLRRGVATPLMVVAVFFAMGFGGAMVEELQLPALVALLVTGLAIGAAVIANRRFDQWAGRPLRITAVRSQLVHLEGAGEAYLASLDPPQPTNDMPSENRPTA